MVAETSSSFNVKIDEQTREKFKKLTHDRGTTMQAVISAFIASYTKDPDRYSLSMEVRRSMSFPRGDISINPTSIDYDVQVFNNFSVRKVVNPNEENDVYHMKVLDENLNNSVVKYIKENLPDCESGLIDESGILKLEYPIYIIVSDIMRKESMKCFLDTLDQNF